MSRPRSAARITRESVRATLWFWPTVWAAVAIAITGVLLVVRPAAVGAPSRWRWPGGQDSAGVLLQVVASSVMAATTVTFSLTIVALQLSSQQFSPRLLREFARDRVTQAVLAILLSTFVSALTAVLGLGHPPLPVFALVWVFVLGIASAGALIIFVGHLVRSLRVDSLMREVHAETMAMIASTYPIRREPVDGTAPPRASLPDRPPEIHRLAPVSGFVRRVHAEELARAAGEHGLVVQLRVRPGDHVTRGTPLARVWRDEGYRDEGHRVDGRRDDEAGPDVGGVEAIVDRAIELAYERTMEQDIAYGFRQLTDIAVKALSPAVNDPVTAVHAVGYCGDLLVHLHERDVGPGLLRDASGAVRVVVPERDDRYWLDLVCGPVRRYGAAEPIVLGGLLGVLRDCVTSARTAARRNELLRQADLVLEQASPDLAAVDRAEVEDRHRRVVAAASGDLDAAFDDRAGESRSV